MIVTLTIEIPDHWYVGSRDRVDIADSEVRDPAAGVVGQVVGRGRINWRDGHRYLNLTVDIDDDAAIAAAVRAGAAF